MKIFIGMFSILLCVVSGNVSADVIATTHSAQNDTCDSLDLNVVASLFGRVENLEDFETQLNDPDIGISDLDLNKDGLVDYLRVVEIEKGSVRLVTVQAVIGKKQFQDVATIEVEKSDGDEITVQVVGNAMLYGDDNIIEPVYDYPPVFPLLFWATHYRPWRSPFYWEHYPHNYHSRASKSKISVEMPRRGEARYLGTKTLNQSHQNSGTSTAESSQNKEINVQNKQSHNRVLSTHPGK